MMNKLMFPDTSFYRMLEFIEIKMDAMCYAQDYKYPMLSCTRLKGHTGRHAAAGIDCWFKVWPDERN